MEPTPGRRTLTQDLPPAERENPLAAAEHQLLAEVSQLLANLQLSFRPFNAAYETVRATFEADAQAKAQLRDLVVGAVGAMVPGAIGDLLQQFAGGGSIDEEMFRRVSSPHETQPSRWASIAARSAGATVPSTRSANRFGSGHVTRDDSPGS